MRMQIWIIYIISWHVCEIHGTYYFLFSNLNGAVFEPDILNKKCMTSRFFLTVNVSIQINFRLSNVI